MAYRDEVMADSPAAYWRLGEATPGTGTAADETGTNNGTYVASPTGVPGLLLGDSNGAVDFNGSSQYVSIADHASLKPTVAVTVEAWVKLDSTAASMMVFRKDLALRLGINAGGVPFWQVRIAGTPRTVSWGSALTPGVIYHLFGTYSDTTNVLAFSVNNGTAVTGSFSGAISTTTVGAAIGRVPNSSSEYFDGVIDEVAVYGSALSDARRGVHYAEGLRQVLLPSGVGSGQALGSPAVSAPSLVSPSPVASAEAFGSASVARGAVALSPAAIASGEQHGAPALAAGAVTILPGSVASAEAHGQPALIAGAVALLPGFVGSQEAHGAATLQAGAVVLLPPGVASGEGHGSPVFQPGAVALLPGAIASLEAFGAPALDVSGALRPVSIPSEEQHGTPEFTVGAVVLIAAAIPTSEAHGQPVLGAGSVVLAPAPIGTAETFGLAELGESYLLLPQPIPSSEAVGSPALALGAALLLVQAIASEEDFGLPLVIREEGLILVAEAGYVVRAAEASVAVGSKGGPVEGDGLAVARERPARIPRVRPGSV